MIGQMRIPELTRILFSKGEQSRGVERLRRAGLTGVTSVLAQGITILAGFISLRLTLNYLGEERYGVWLTINTLLNWLYVSQMGLGGNALVNKLSEAYGKDDNNLAQEIAATAFWSLAGIAALFFLLFVLSLPFVNWSPIFNTSEAVAASELQLSVILAFICFVMMFPTSMVDAVYQSYQEGYIGNIWNIAGSIFSLIALIAVTRTEGGLPLLVASLFGVRLLFSFFNAGYLFFFRHPWLMPSPKAVTKNSFKELMNLGSKYLLAQFSGIGMFQSQPVIITQVTGPSGVTIFGIAKSLLTLPSTVVLMMTNPLLSAYGEAKARGDWDWIRKTLKRTLIASAIGSILMVLPLCFFAKTIIYYWTKGRTEVLPSNELIAVFGIYVVLNCIATPASVMLYGIQRVGAQAIYSLINAVLTVVLGIVLTQIYGLLGMAIAMTLAYALVNPIAQITQVRLAFKEKN
jgi:O-antigen/teichoic acid export membrane protein